jgi:hypothetical protein
VLLRGSRGLAESYAAGRWDTPDLTGVIRVAAPNVGAADAIRRRAPVREPYTRVAPAGRDARGGADGQARAHLPQARPAARAPRRRDRHRLGPGDRHDDRSYAVEKAARTFIRTYIFPNGCLPSQEVIARCVARRTDLRAVHVEDLTPHYVETLRAWRANVERSVARLAELGYDERFRRLWRLYLAYCEAGFAERRIGLLQSVLAKPGWCGAVAPEPVAWPEIAAAG